MACTLAMSLWLADVKAESAPPASSNILLQPHTRKGEHSRHDAATEESGTNFANSIDLVLTPAAEVVSETPTTLDSNSTLNNHIDSIAPQPELLTLKECLRLTTQDNPSLKAVASQVEQAQSALRAQIALWYPTLSLTATLPSYRGGESSTADRNTPLRRTTESIWQMDAALQAAWRLIDPSRTPRIASARDQFEKAKNQYLIALRELRLQVAQTYLDLQQADDGVRIGQESVRASLVSLRDAKARFQAGVATKLEVLQAETQLARDQQVLTGFLSSQSITRRVLASQLDLPQTITPTASDPSLVLGVWRPSLQESIVAAYAFREELDQGQLSSEQAAGPGECLPLCRAPRFYSQRCGRKFLRARKEQPQYHHHSPGGALGSGVPALGPPAFPGRCHHPA